MERLEWFMFINKNSLSRTWWIQRYFGNFSHITDIWTTVLNIANCNVHRSDLRYGHNTEIQPIPRVSQVREVRQNEPSGEHSCNAFHSIDPREDLPDEIENK